MHDPRFVPQQEHQQDQDNEEHHENEEDERKGEVEVGFDFVQQKVQQRCQQFLALFLDVLALQNIQALLYEASASTSASGYCFFCRHKRTRDTLYVLDTQKKNAMWAQRLGLAPSKHLRKT